MFTYLLSFVTTFAATVVLTPLASGLAARWGIVDRPDGHRKLQQRPIPLLGGLAVLAGWWLGLAIVQLCGLPLCLPSMMPRVALTLAVLLLTGLCDDALNLRARWKLLAQVMSVLPIALAGCALHRLSLCGWTIELGSWSVPLTVAWLVLGINALNLIDGMDGMASTAGVCIALTAAAIDLSTGGGPVATVTFSLAGALAGFLVFNFPPARIYLGDAGSMVVGLAVSLAALLVVRTETGTTNVTLMLAVMSVPLADMGLAVLRRSLAGHSIWYADRGHIHHRLLDSGWRPWQVLCLLAAIAVAWGTLITVVRNGPHEAAIWGAGAVTAVLAIRFRLAGHYEWSQLARMVRRSGDEGVAVPTADELLALSFAAAWARLVQVCAGLSCSRVTLSVGRPNGSWSEHDWTAESPDSSGEQTTAVEVSRRSSHRDGCRLRIESSAKLAGRDRTRVMSTLEAFAQFWADHPQTVPATVLRLDGNSQPALDFGVAPPISYEQGRAA